METKLTWMASNILWTSFPLSENHFEKSECELTSMSWP